MRSGQAGVTPPPAHSPSANANARPFRPKADGGVTLLEIVIAMLLLGLVAAGTMGAFVFGRRVSVRSVTELNASQIQAEIMEELRLAVGEGAPNKLRLVPGIYVDDFMQNPPTGWEVPRDGDGNPVTPNPLNFPLAFRRFQTDPGTAPTLAGHGDGTLMIIEDWDDGAGPSEDLDGDTLTGLNFDFPPDTNTDLRRVRLRVRWSSPTA